METPLTYPVLAHAPEFHGQPTPNDSNGDNSAVESEVPALSTDAEPIEFIEVPASEPPQLASIPAGLGESLLTIIVSVPWVLMALRVQLNS
ncbi:MAG: hypothetical protein AAGA83_15240 [Cyanobacteria bacterium P01_F01_bin.116]